jgi:hypothetical protein
MTSREIPLAGTLWMIHTLNPQLPIFLESDAVRDWVVKVNSM